MTAAPSVSVVIPTHNRAGVLGRCLDSVLRQTLQPFEVVVVDDGSTDETERIVREQGSALVRYVPLPSRVGAQAARNRGIREARGDWIAFQDSDDEWLPDKLERQIRLLAERGFDAMTVVHGQGIVHPASGEPWWIPRRPLEDGDVLEALLRRPATVLPALLVSKVALDRIGGLDENVPAHHEWDLSIRLAGTCRFVGTAEPVFVYHRGAADAISSSLIRDIRGYQYVIEKFRSEILERCGEDAWQAHLRRQLRRALEFELWDEARGLLALLDSRGVRYYGYVLCLRLRLRPSYVARALRLLGRRRTRRHADAVA
jgi:glycosyltransferase involved in cell wall biosynthesis